MISIYLEHDKSWSLLQHLELAASRSILQHLAASCSILQHLAAVAAVLVSSCWNCTTWISSRPKELECCHVVHSILAIVFGQQFTKLQQFFLKFRLGTDRSWNGLLRSIPAMCLEQAVAIPCHFMSVRLLVRSFAPSFPPSFPPLFVRSFVLVCLFVCLLVCLLLLF